MKIIDGKKISNDVLDEIKNHVEDRVNNRKKVPHLAAILVGDDGPSQTYVNSRLGHVKELDLTRLYSNSMLILPRMSC